MGDALTRLAGRLHGEVLLPDDPGYDDPRLAYNRRPPPRVGAVPVGRDPAPRRGGVRDFLDADGEPRLHEAYPDGAYRRLVQVKRRYDPTNLFHRNLNIRPAGTSAR